MGAEDFLKTLRKPSKNLFGCGNDVENCTC
jgi:hypothetical protein